MSKISVNVPLANLNSFHLEAKAGTFFTPGTREDIDDYLNTIHRQGPMLILGGGTNLLLTGDYNGTVIHPVNKTLEIIDEDRDEIRILAGAGLNWDVLVNWSVDMNYGGLENLSLIPGTVGAAPVQNIGAYGSEAGQTIRSVRAIDLKNGMEFSLACAGCHFGYRDSVFKRPDHQAWLIWEVEFGLSRAPVLNLAYEPLARELSKIKNPTLHDAREAVIRIRRSKLPDPDLTGNAGSFFKNPVVEDVAISELQVQYPDLPVFKQENGLNKIPAGWLIERCGWKGYRDGPVGVYPEQALVLVNYGGATAGQILDLASRIELSVLEKFGIRLEREVRVV